MVKCSRVIVLHAVNSYEFFFFSTARCTDFMVKEQQCNLSTAK